jgi:prepilin-type N-terminal cleavage/methylation domain-containing protein
MTKSRNKSYQQSGFTLMETLVVMVIITIIASMMTVLIFKVREKARDMKRKADLTTIGRFFTASCYKPDAGAGTYDLADIIAEVKAKNEQYQKSFSGTIFDPKSGNQQKSNYIYILNADNHCCLYANLENDDEPVTISNISIPTPGAGAGVFLSNITGQNGSKKYYQISN